MTTDGRQAGYSLLELLACLAIVGLLFSLGSGMSELLSRERRFQAVLDLRRSLNYARSSAVFMQTQVTLCALDQWGECARNWYGRDYAVFVDKNRDHRLNEGEALRIGHWSADRGTLTWRAALRRRYITFKSGGDTAQNGSFYFCPQGSDKATRIVVNRAGRNYVETAHRRVC